MAMIVQNIEIQLKEKMPIAAHDCAELKNEGKQPTKQNKTKQKDDTSLDSLISFHFSVYTGAGYNTIFGGKLANENKKTKNKNEIHFHFHDTFQ